MKKTIIILLSIMLSSTYILNAAYLKVGVADADLNKDPNSKDTVTVTVTTDHGETESLQLMESGINTSRFTALLPVEKSTTQSADEDGKIFIHKNTILKVVYTDENYGKAGEKKLQANLRVDVASEQETSTTTTTNDPEVVAQGEEETGSDTVSATPEEESSSKSSGGGCSSNPNGKSFDVMFLIMLGLSLFYPLRRRFIG